MVIRHQQGKTFKLQKQTLNCKNRDCPLAEWTEVQQTSYGDVWLGWKLLRAPNALADPIKVPPPRIGFFWQGFLVLLSNPEALLLFGAFIPQFVDPRARSAKVGTGFALDRALPL